MCFIFSDGKTRKIINILDKRRNSAIKNYFIRFTKKSLKRVKYVAMYINASYPFAIKKTFPNTEIVIGRFHIIQQLTKAMNKKTY